ncbi:MULTISPECIES: hypothetical protein [unclassified Microbulbifer]|uniref:hypothetical protein n=1 Tax=unclassified Microbulbifer TaxID=2619833 RepID=UPI0027E4F84E|nr:MULTISPECIES: hypothetical protein [unclassified Microbulbifer]
MRAPITLFLLFTLGLAGCATTTPRHSLVQSALADTHLGWQPAPKNQLAFSVATASGIARVELRPLPADLHVLTLHLPGMRRVEGVQWQADDGDNTQLYDGVDGSEGVSLQPWGHGFRLQISGEALELVRGGGVLTVIDVYRG